MRKNGLNWGLVLVGRIVGWAFSPFCQIVYTRFALLICGCCLELWPKGIITSTLWEWGEGGFFEQKPVLARGPTGCWPKKSTQNLWRKCNKIVFSGCGVLLLSCQLLSPSSQPFDISKPIERKWNSQLKEEKQFGIAEMKMESLYRKSKKWLEILMEIGIELPQNDSSKRQWGKDVYQQKINLADINPF